MNLHDKERDVQKLYKAQKLALYWLLGLIYSGFIGFQLGRIQAITDFNYNLHEIMYVPSAIALYVVPVVFLIYIYFLIKYLLVMGKQKVGVKTSIQAVFVIVSILVVVSITSHQSHEVSTTGVYEVEKKLHQDRKYYLVVDDKTVRVSYNEFQLIEKNHLYLISFVWNKRTPHKGQLETIEPVK
ncbi:hypothetical protein ACIQ2D_21235 [Lysinibacillus sp. NPDC097287]|uniref:hypothetical protein n=1 Tax=Lysinibacillus sp. NPDC097287 TaxID=3364144 RepID=UPI0037F139DB